MQESKKLNSLVRQIGKHRMFVFTWSEMVVGALQTYIIEGAINK